MKNTVAETGNIRLAESSLPALALPALTLPVGGLDIWWVPLPEIEYSELLANYSDCLSHEEHQRLLSRRLPKGQFQFVFTRVVLRYLLSAYHPSITPDMWQINRSESGRPHLSTEQTPLSFNLTHTDDCMIFAFSQHADPGVDVELISRSMEFDGVARRYFSALEYNELQGLPEAGRAEFFYRLWTLKEAAVKASGLGLARGLRKFQFGRTGQGGFWHLTDLADSEGLSGDFRFWSTCLGGYVAAAALTCQQPSTLPEITPVSRHFCWPDIVSEITPEWIKCQSRNSSTNLEP